MKKIFLVGVPHHANLGDTAICYAEKKFIQDYFKSHELHLIPENGFNIYFKKQLENDCIEGDIIFMQGGGNMGYEYFIAEELRRNIIQMFPKNKIIIFPQTIYFKNTQIEKEEFEKSKMIYANHKDLTLIAREEKSYKIMKENFPNNNVLLTPDIVMYLDETKNNEKERSGVVFLKRNDLEKILDDKDIEELNKIISKYSNNVTYLDTIIGGEDTKKETPEILERLETIRTEDFQKLLAEIRKAKLVITDRLHGMIFATITSTPCIAFDNYNYKVRESSKWLQHFDYVKYINNIKDRVNIENSIKELMNIKNARYDNSFAIEKYEQIIEMVKKN